MVQQPGKSLEVARERRTDLLGVLGDLERALAAPAAADPSSWIGSTEKVMLSLRDEFDVHIDVTEGPGGLYEECIEAAPRVAVQIGLLTREHRKLTAAIDLGVEALNSGEADMGRIDALRDQLLELLRLLIRHRQRGADLVWDAYNVDIGGE
ncbi:MAG: hypothetical protein U0U69_16980 [Acidimicrobiia bacterium]